jgi:hypothetical protein
MNVRFCHNCRSLILADFRFCPYCGSAANKGPEIDEALDGPFERLGVRAGDPDRGRGDVFAQAEKSLERLESDMNLILEELGKEGRQ